jgi:hypothetical protein
LESMVRHNSWIDCKKAGALSLVNFNGQTHNIISLFRSFFGINDACPSCN